MRCEFSETQFSFCFTFEFINKYTPWSAIPFFPSTYLEGQPGYGYDVKVGGNIFFQYKVPEFITRKNSRNPIQWNSLNGPFYRITVNTNSEQYRLLKELKRIGNEVCYITPQFHKIAEISNFYNESSIVENSLTYQIEFLPDYGSNTHNICYSKNEFMSYIFSKPKMLKKVMFSQVINEMKSLKSRDKSIIDVANSIKNLLIEHFNFEYLKDSNSQNIVDQIRGTLLSNFNILWIPIIK